MWERVKPTGFSETVATELAKDSTRGLLHIFTVVKRKSKEHRDKTVCILGCPQGPHLHEYNHTICGSNLDSPKVSFQTLTQFSSSSKPPIPVGASWGIKVYDLTKKPKDQPQEGQTIWAHYVLPAEKNMAPGLSVLSPPSLTNLGHKRWTSRHVSLIFCTFRRLNSHHWSGEQFLNAPQVLWQFPTLICISGLACQLRVHALNNSFCFIKLIASVAVSTPLGAIAFFFL